MVSKKNRDCFEWVANRCGRESCVWGVHPVGIIKARLDLSVGSSQSIDGVLDSQDRGKNSNVYDFIAIRYDGAVSPFGFESLSR